MRLRSKLSLYTVLISGVSFFLTVLIVFQFDNLGDSPKVHGVQKSVKHHGRHVFKKGFTLSSSNASLVQQLIQDKLDEPQFSVKLSQIKTTQDFSSLIHADGDYDDGQDNYENIWRIPASWLTSREVIPRKAQQLEKILKLMVTSRIIKSSIPPKGSQLKILLVLEGDQQVLFKPKRYTRDHVINGTPYSGADRHNGEIVAFHLSRLLDFRLAPITVGRRVHVSKEIKSTASENLLATFLQDKGKSDCFFGRCLYCNKDDYVCPNEDDGYLEGALILMFPARYKLERLRSPWQRTYKDGVNARWETDVNYCQARVMPNLPLNRVLDLVDTSIFDFLINNADRHHFEVLRASPESAIFLIDNGKSFGNPFHDEVSILAPLYQCCIVRSSTYDRLLDIYATGLSKSMDRSTKDDPLYPLLTGEHLFALDRRLKQILALIDICIDEKGKSKVLK